MVTFLVYLNRRVFVMVPHLTFSCCLGKAVFHDCGISCVSLFIFLLCPSRQFQPSLEPHLEMTLRKHAYSNILKFLPLKNENFLIKISDIFHISAQNIYCGYSLEPLLRDGSNEYPQSMVLNRNTKNNVYPCKLQFYYIKVGFKGIKII